MVDTSSGELPAVTSGGDPVVGSFQKSSTDAHCFYQGIELTLPKGPFKCYVMLFFLKFVTNHLVTRL